MGDHRGRGGAPSKTTFMTGYRPVRWRYIRERDFVEVSPEEDPIWLKDKDSRERDRILQRREISMGTQRSNNVADGLENGPVSDPIPDSTVTVSSLSSEDPSTLNAAENYPCLDSSDSGIFSSTDLEDALYYPAIDLKTNKTNGSSIEVAENIAIAMTSSNYAGLKVPKAVCGLGMEKNDDEKIINVCQMGNLTMLSTSDIFMREPDTEENSDDENIIPEAISIGEITVNAGNSSTSTCSSGIRDYQLALFEIAKEKNIIACLPTGSGKTLIAIKLMNFFWNAVKTGRKKIVFLANTVPLLKQQAEVISKCTSYSVQIVHGGNKNQWKDWSPMVSTFEVLVMIPAIFMDRMDHGYLSFKDITLLVLDECHHALKANPMSVIMSRYKEIQSKKLYSMPRVLGLSATILKKNIGVECVDKAIKEVEDTLCCTAVTYEAFEQVLRYSTNAELVIERYDTHPRLEWANENFPALLNNMDQFLQRHLNHMSRDTTGTQSTEELMALLDKRKKDQQVFRDMVNSIQDIRTVFAEVGPFGAMIAANIKYQYFLNVFSSTLTGNIKHLFLTSLRTFIFRIHRFLSTLDTLEKFMVGCSWKVLILLILLERFSRNGEELCGIIFVQRRLEAHALGAFLEELKIQCPHEWGFIKPAVILGTNSAQCEPPKYRQSGTHQAQLINAFHSGKANIVVSTSILQEGIDVQSCSFVVRFDRIESYPSFVQSMGRARRKDSKYALLIPSDLNESARAAALVEKFQLLKAHINENLQEQMGLINAALQNRSEDHVDDEKDKILIKKIQELEFCPGGQPDSPKITLYNAVGTVNKYTSLLKSASDTGTSSSEDSKSALSLVRKVSGIDGESDPEYDNFYAIVKLPNNSVVKGLTTGPVMTGSINAKRAGFLEVCRRLYEAGALDKDLNPIKPKSSK